MERSLRLGEFTLSSGESSSYYVDARPSTMSAEGQYLLGRLVHRLVVDEELRPDVVGGLTMGADPVAYAVAHTSWTSEPRIDAFSVRKEAKEHGTGRRIEGSEVSGRRAVVVEDTVTTGGSALDAAAAVEAGGGEVVAVVAVVDREEGGRKRVEEAGYPFFALFTAADLLDAGSPGSTG